MARRWAPAALLLLGRLWLAPSPVTAQQWTMQLDLKGRRIEGAPLTWSDNRVVLLARDGYLWDFHPREAENYRKTSDGFRGYAQSELRNNLLREFGRGFDVSGTGHYLVVHPANQRDVWAPRFEELYRSFVHYFTARGMRPQQPPFPLIAVVFPDQASFRRRASTTGVSISPGVLGYYSPVSNRILLYDVTEGNGGKGDWRRNADTIIHEAAHQTAFNTGVHSRSSTPPQWMVEGVGTLFEARGVWNSHTYPQRSDRVNQGQLSAFRRYAAAGRSKESLRELVSSDRMFHTDPGRAYAESWALTFFLTESEPRKYVEYLSLTASTPPLSVQTSAERLRDFSQKFGADFAMLDARLVRFMNEL